MRKNRVMAFIGPRGRQTPLYQLNLTATESTTTSASPTAAEIVPANQPTTPAMQPMSSTVKPPPLAIDVINHYLNDLADEQVPATTRLKRLQEAYRYFDPQRG